MHELLLRRFEEPDETIRFEKGIFEIVRMGGVTLGRARYEPYVSLHFLGADHDARG